MPCPHAVDCPLFPRLQQSLDSWVAAYCANDDGWPGCARHEASLTGTSVPISLLPNGRTVAMWETRATRAAPPAATSTVAVAEACPTPPRGLWARVAAWFGGRR